VWYLGVWQVAWWIIRCVDLYLRTSRHSEVIPANYGQGSKVAWAIVTGADDLLGQALCKGLAKRGFNILMMGEKSSVM